MKYFKKRNIPNIISIFRIVLIPLFVFLALQEDNRYIFWAVVVFVTAGLSDILDGYLARRFGWVTDVGKLLDPFADKMMQVSALICLYIRGLLPLWLVFTIIIKELLMIVGAAMILKRGKFYVSSSWYGKLGTTVFYLAVIAIIIIHDNGSFISNLLSILLLILTIFTFVMYYISIYKGRYLKERQTSRDK